MPETIIRFHPEALKEAEIAQEWYADRSIVAAYAFVGELADETHTAPSISDPKRAAPDGVNNHTNTPQFRNTVSQNAKRNDAFFDLWRSVS